MEAWQKGTLFDSQTTDRRRTYAGNHVERVRSVHKTQYPQSRCELKDSRKEARID